MESAYGFALDDSAAASKYGVEKDLLDIFVKSVGSASTPPPTAEELESMKTKAEERKSKGEADIVRSSICMGEGVIETVWKFRQSVQCLGVLVSFWR